jgi:hypothetical protein
MLCASYYESLTLPHSLPLAMICQHKITELHLTANLVLLQRTHFRHVCNDIVDEYCNAVINDLKKSSRGMASSVIVFHETR